MDLKKAFEQLKFDCRLVEWNMRHGKLSKDEYQKYLSTLGDDASKAQSMTIDDSHEEDSELESLNGGQHN